MLNIWSEIHFNLQHDVRLAKQKHSCLSNSVTATWCTYSLQVLISEEKKEGKHTSQPDKQDTDKVS